MNHCQVEAHRKPFPQDQWSVGGGLHSEDNEDHYREERHFFEWWYFDIAFNDGSWLVAVLHSALYCMGNHRPAIDLRYYPTKGPPVEVFRSFSRSEYETTLGRFKIRIDKSWAASEKGIFRLHLYQGPLEAKLTFHPKLSGVKVGGGHLFADSFKKKYFNWVVPVPKAFVEGTLRVHGETRLVEGVGYHDHNWGNIYLPNAFRGWVWGRVWGGKHTLVFGDLIPQDGTPNVTPLLLGCDGKVRVISDGFQLRWDDITTDTIIDTNELCKLFLEDKGNQDISLSLTLKKPMETAKIAALYSWLVPLRRLVEPLFYLTQKIPMLGQLIGLFVGKGLYYRYQAQGVLRIADEVTEVQGLVEKMVLKSGI